MHVLLHEELLLSLLLLNLQALLQLSGLLVLQEVLRLLLQVPLVGVIG